jgi:hypothetical protein
MPRRSVVTYRSGYAPPSAPCLSRKYPGHNSDLSKTVRYLPAKVVAIEKRDDQYFQVIIQIGTRYRGSFNTLAFGEINLYTGSLKDNRLDLVYYRDPGLKTVGSIPTLDAA